MYGVKKTFSLYLRNFIFGVEDSLVSTVGLLSGVAIAGLSKQVILLTGIVLIFIEAFSMAAGSLLSEHSVQEYIDKKEEFSNNAILGGTIMFFSYFLFGFIPLFPYIIFDAKYAFWISIFFALATLFLLGAVSATVFRTNVIKHGLEMLIIGGVVILVGVIVGRFVNGISYI